MTIHLERVLPRASRDQPGRQAENGPGPKPVPPLFGLAPGGVYRAAPVAGRAVRSCRTVSPLPVRRRSAGRADWFLWHFPWGCPRRTLSGTACPWSPDFPPRRPFGDCTGRPSGRLTPSGMGGGSPAVKGDMTVALTKRSGMRDQRFREGSPDYAFGSIRATFGLR